jgi:hypothetical protein
MTEAVPFKTLMDRNPAVREHHMLLPIAKLKAQLFELGYDVHYGVDPDDANNGLHFFFDSFGTVTVFAPTATEVQKMLHHAVNMAQIGSIRP